MSTSFEMAKKVQGTAQASDGDADKTVIAAPGTGKAIYVQHVNIMVTTGGADAGGLASLEDGVGGTKFVSIDADAGGVPLPAVHFDFGCPGYKLTDNTLLNLTVDGDGTTEATATATVTGIVI